jgi:hypothetical protein
VAASGPTGVAKDARWRKPTFGAGWGTERGWTECGGVRARLAGGI